MDTAGKIAAVVVTYNRKELLVECLHALRQQSRPVDHIFLVDNASTDGTAELLKKTDILSDARIEYIRLPNNMGGAGGFHEGMLRAFEAGYDWIWLMDDDVEPYPDGLEGLLHYCSASGCIHGRRMKANQTPFIWGEHFDPVAVSTTLIPDALFGEKQEAREVNVGCFEGMLVSREVIAKVGLPDPDFFICFDDTLFGYLASQVTRVLYVNVFSLKRKLSTPAMHSSLFSGGKLDLPSTMSIYYFCRNRFLVAKKLKNYSFAFMLWSLRILIRSTARELFVRQSGKGARAVIGGFWDGLRCWLGLAKPTTGRR